MLYLLFLLISFHPLLTSSLLGSAAPLPYEDEDAAWLEEASLPTFAQI
jgi:hypothetical protein